MTEIIKFKAPPHTTGFYTCSASGDRSGEYVAVEIADRLATDLLMEGTTMRADGYWRPNTMAQQQAVDYLEQRGKVERHPEYRGLFIWIGDTI